jgi:formate dehydrogenase subunit gamma
MGMEGAFEGMWDGTVDANWAKQHHSLWAEKETAQIRPQLSAAE